MGGDGSTRWNFHTKAIPVEQCAKLDVSTFERAGLLKPVLSAGVLNLGPGSEADFVIGPDGQERRLLVLQRKIATWRGIKVPHEQAVPITFRRPIRGKPRWQFRCPILRNGQPCERVAEKLYLPPGRDDFGCRDCHHLTYLSCQRKGRYSTCRRQMLRSAKEVGLTAADTGLDLPEAGAVALLRELLDGR